MLIPLLFLTSCAGVTKQRGEMATLTPAWPTPLPVVSDKLSRNVESIGQFQSPGILYVPSPYHAIRLLNPDSGEQSLVLSTEETVKGLGWSPDHSHFLYSTESGAAVVDFESGHSTRLADKMYVSYAKWATSTLIYYCVFEHVGPDGETALDPCFIYDIDTGETFKVAPKKQWADKWMAVYTYQTSPGYKHVAFTVKDDSNYYLGDTVTGIVKPIYEMAFEFPYEGAIFGSWSPDGERLAFSVSHCCIDGEHQSTLHVIDANGENLRMILDLNLAYPQHLISPPFGLKWSPDGHWLSFVLRKADGSSESETIHLVRPTGEELQDLGIRADGSSYIWSPDGQKLLIHREVAVSPRQDDFFIADINTGEEMRLTFDGKYKIIVDW
jgi:hypothetical protein